MAFLAVDADGRERIFNWRPVRETEMWDMMQMYVNLPTGTIRKLIGRELTWEDEPIEIK